MVSPAPAGGGPERGAERVFAPERLVQLQRPVSALKPVPPEARPASRPLHA